MKPLSCVHPVGHVPVLMNIIAPEGTVEVEAAAPRLESAPAAVLAPVPPLAIGICAASGQHRTKAKAIDLTDAMLNHPNRIEMPAIA